MNEHYFEVSARELQDGERGWFRRGKSMVRWQEIAKELALMRQHEDDLRNEWMILKNQCKHPNLPQRGPTEDYMDTCPDCGHTRYQYAI